MKKLLGVIFGLSLFLVTSTSVMSDGKPFIQVVPSTITSGQTAVVYGKGFCGAESCSPVTIKQGNQVLYYDVRPDAEGNFQFPFVVTIIYNGQIITATQTTKDGVELKATTQILIIPAAPNYSNSTNSPVNQNSPLSNKQLASTKSVQPTSTNSAPVNQYKSSSSYDQQIFWLTIGILIGVVLAAGVFILKKKYKKF